MAARPRNEPVRPSTSALPSWVDRSMRMMPRHRSDERGGLSHCPRKGTTRDQGDGVSQPIQPAIWSD